MENDPCKQEWDAYLEASKELDEATKAAKSLETMHDVNPGEDIVRITGAEIQALRRLAKAKEASVERHKAWEACRKSHGLDVKEP